MNEQQLAELEPDPIQIWDPKCYEDPRVLASLLRIMERKNLNREARARVFGELNRVWWGDPTIGDPNGETS